MDTIFWDVDTQFDFMTPAEEGGKLYVKQLQDPNDPGAVEIKPALARLSTYARDHGILRVATADWHSLEHREIDAESPDFRTTYPPHCMAGEPGAEKVPETELRDPIVIPLGAEPAAARDAAEAAARGGRDILLRKEEFSCFLGNPATDELLRALDPSRVVVYGVSLDVCVRYAIDGMLERGEKVYLVQDATWGLGVAEADELLRDWESRGVKLVTTDEVVASYPPRLP